MASSDETPGPMPPGDGSMPPGKPMSFGQQMVDNGANVIQSLKPKKQISQHVCTFALYSHDMSRQIETHHYVSRLNQDFLQCAVYDSDDSHARLIGVEYIVSDRIFPTLPPEEQKLWHSHAYEGSGRIHVFQRQSRSLNSKILLRPMANFGVLGKLIEIVQCEAGDRLPLGAPALMISPQVVNIGTVMPELVRKRDDKYKISTENLRISRAYVTVPESALPSNADYWLQSGKGFAIDVEPTEMKKITPFP